MMTFRPVSDDYRQPPTAGGDEDGSSLPTYGETTTTAATEVADSYAIAAGEAPVEDEESSGETLATAEAVSPGAGYEVNTVPQTEQKKQGQQQQPSKSNGTKKPTAAVKNGNGAAVAPSSELPTTGFSLPQESLPKANTARVAPASGNTPPTVGPLPLPAVGALPPPAIGALPSPAPAAQPTVLNKSAVAAGGSPTETLEEESIDSSAEETTEESSAADESESSVASIEEAVRLCPGGSLAACVRVCPGSSGRVYGACVEGCGERCPQ
jgi:hypothetical protein